MELFYKNNVESTLDSMIKFLRHSQKKDGSGIQKLNELRDYGMLPEYLYNNIRPAVEDFEVPYELIDETHGKTTEFSIEYWSSAKRDHYFSEKQTRELMDLANDYATNPKKWSEGTYDEFVNNKINDFKQIK